MEHGILVYCPRHKLMEVPTTPRGIEAAEVLSNRQTREQRECPEIWR